MRRLALAACALALGSCAKPQLHVSMPPSTHSNAADLPAPRLQEYEWASIKDWTQEHARLVAEAAKGEAEIVFYGDSITAGWSGTRAWATHWLPKKAFNFGIGGDCTQKLLWRLQNGEAGRLQPKQVVLLIGTNNLGLFDHAPKDVAKAHADVVRLLKQRFPSAQIWVLAVFPSEESPEAPKRAKIRELNLLLQAAAPSQGSSYLDLSDAFLLPGGRLNPALMPDFLHLSEEGYEAWSQGLLKAMQ